MGGLRLVMRGAAAGGAFRFREVLAGQRVPGRRAGRGCSPLAPLTDPAAGADARAGAAGVGGAHHHVAAAGSAADAGGDSRGSTAGAEIATDDATAGAADA